MTIVCCGYANIKNCKFEIRKWEFRIMVTVLLMNKNRVA